MRILFCCLFNHVEQARLHLLAVDDELSAEYLVATMLRVNLCEAENLAVSERSSQLFLHVVKVLYLGRR